MGSWGRNPTSQHLTTYEAAAKHEDSIVPIRGRAVECKPFGDRRYQALTIRKDTKPNTVLGGENDTTTTTPTKPDIVVRLHSTDIVRFKPDGTIIINLGGYNTTTTHTAINEVTGLRVCSQYGYAVVGGCGLGDNQLAMHDDEDNIFVLNSRLYYPVLTLTNPRQTYTHKVNRKVVNDMRKEYASFLDYAAPLCRVADGSGALGIKRDSWGGIVRDYNSSFTSPITFRSILAKAKSDDPADNYEAAKYLSQVKPVWVKEKREWQNGLASMVNTDTQNLYATITQSLNYLLIRAYPEETLTKHAVPMGTIQKDEYARWV